MDFLPTEDMMTKSILISNVGLISFTFGYLCILRFNSLRPNFNLCDATLVEGKAYLIAFFILCPLILYSLYLMLTMRQEYGVEVLNELGSVDMTFDPDTGARLFVDTTGYVVLARNMVLPFVTFLILHFRGRWWSYVPLMAVAFMAAETGGRWPLVMSGLVAIMSGLYLQRRSVLRLRSYVAIVIGLGAFLVLGESRDAFMKFLATGSFDFQFDFVNSSFGAHPDFANFEFLTYVIAKVPDFSNTYSYFTQYLGVFTWPIPRILWPGKPAGSPITLVNLTEYGHFTSGSVTLVGDGWISLGYPGVIITLMVAGALYGYLYKRFCSRSASRYYVCAYIWLVALLAQWARDGGYRILEFVFFCLAPVGLAYCVSRLLSKPAGPFRLTRATSGRWNKGIVKTDPL